MRTRSIALRSRRRHRSETAERVARGSVTSGDSHAVPARAAPLRAAPAEARCRAVRPYTVRDLMFPLGCTAVGIGSHLFAVCSPARAQKVVCFAPRGVFDRGDAMFTGGRNRDPMPSGTPTATPFPHTMRGRPDHRSASATCPFSPAGREVKMINVVRVV